MNKKKRGTCAICQKVFRVRNGVIPRHGRPCPGGQYPPQEVSSKALYARLNDLTSAYVTYAHSFQVLGQERVKYPDPETWELRTVEADDSDLVHHREQMVVLLNLVNEETQAVTKAINRWRPSVDMEGYDWLRFTREWAAAEGRKVPEWVWSLIDTADRAVEELNQARYQLSAAHQLVLTMGDSPEPAEASAFAEAVREVLS